MPVSRELLRHGMLLLIVALLEGFGIVAAAPDQKKMWASHHVTRFLSALILLAAGLVWPHLLLSAGTLAKLEKSFVWWAWSVVGADAWMRWFKIPSMIWQQQTEPDLTALPTQIFFFAVIPVIVIVPFVNIGTVFYGLRGSAPPKQA